MAILLNELKVGDSFYICGSESLVGILCKKTAQYDKYVSVYSRADSKETFYGAYLLVVPNNML